MVSNIDEKKARLMDPGCFLVLPWHFKESITRKEKDFLEKGNSLLYPLPEVKLVTI